MGSEDEVEDGAVATTGGDDERLGRLSRTTLLGTEEAAIVNPKSNPQNQNHQTLGNDKQCVSAMGRGGRSDRPPISPAPSLRHAGAVAGAGRCYVPRH